MCIFLNNQWINDVDKNTKHRHCVRVTEDEGEAFGGTKSIPIVSNVLHNI